MRWISQYCSVVDNYTTLAPYTTSYGFLPSRQRGLKYCDNFFPHCNLFAVRKKQQNADSYDYQTENWSYWKTDPANEFDTLKYREIDTQHRYPILTWNSESEVFRFKSPKLIIFQFWNVDFVHFLARNSTTKFLISIQKFHPGVIKLSTKKVSRNSSLPNINK